MIQASITRLPNQDLQGNTIPYASNDVCYYDGYWYSWASQPTGFQEIRERGIIQLTAQRSGKVVLEYIGNGSKCNSATKVHPYAQSTVETYIVWKYKANTRTYSGGEVAMAKQDHIIEKQKLISRLDPNTIHDYRDIFTKHRTLGGKR